MGIYDVVRRRRESVIDRHAHVHDIHATMLHLMGLNHIISRTCTMAALSGPRLYQAM